MKVAQHTQSEECASINNVPQTSRKCQMQLETKSKENKKEEIQKSITPTQTATPQTGGGIIGITGRAIKNIFSGSTNIGVGIIITLVIIIGGLTIYNKVLKKKII